MRTPTAIDKGHEDAERIATIIEGRVAEQFESITYGSEKMDACLVYCETATKSRMGLDDITTENVADAEKKLRSALGQFSAQRVIDFMNPLINEEIRRESGREVGGHRK
jgi:hypothetical protein